MPIDPDWGFSREQVRSEGSRKAETDVRKMLEDLRRSDAAQAMSINDLQTTVALLKEDNTVLKDAVNKLTVELRMLTAELRG